MSSDSVRQSNAQIPQHISLTYVAIFVGGTSGIEKSSLKQLVGNFQRLKIYMIGRSEVSASRIKPDVFQINPKATCVFLETDMNTLKNADDTYRKVRYDLGRKWK